MKMKMKMRKKIIFINLRMEMNIIFYLNSENEILKSTPGIAFSNYN